MKRMFDEARAANQLEEVSEEIEEEIPTQEKLVEMFSDDVCRAYDEREEALGPEIMRELERQVLLSVVDRNWREHLYEMDYLREGIGLRAMAQRDPLAARGFQHLVSGKLCGPAQKIHIGALNSMLPHQIMSSS